MIGLLISLLVSFSQPLSHAFVFSYGSSGALTGDHGKYVRELVQAFQKDHPDAKIELRESMSYVKSILQTLMKDYGEEPADVGIAGLVEWPILYKKGLLRPLSSVLSDGERQKITGALSSDLNVQRYGKDVKQKEFILPFNRSFPVLYVNLDLLPGLKKTSITWDELAVLLSAKTDAKMSLASEDWITEQLLMNARGSATLHGQKAQLTDPNTAKIVAKIKAMIAGGQLNVVPNQRQAYLDFIEGRAAVILNSLSSYQSIQSRVKFAMKIVMPPMLEKSKVLVLGGGDLILPLNSKKVFDAKTKKDIRDFINWFYLEKGSALWASFVGYLPVSKPMAGHAVYQSMLKKNPQDASALKNADRWQIKSFYELDELCNIIKVRQAVETTFRQAIENADSTLVLKQAESFIGDILHQPCP